MARKMLFSVRLRHGAAAVPGQRNSNRERELERRNTMNAADTGFILICAAMVFVMTPAVALFYGGLVSARNVLSTSFHSYASLGLVTVIWAFVGYTLAFGPDINGIIGSLKYVFLQGVEGTAAPSAANLPHPCFMTKHSQESRARISRSATRNACISPPCCFFPASGCSLPMLLWLTGSGAAAGWPRWARLTLPAALSCTWLPRLQPWPAPRLWDRG